jgi:uncharacterized protein (DUF433 family)
MDARSNQYVEIRQNRAGEDRPYLAGTRVRVQDIVIDHERLGQPAEAIAQGFEHISIAQIHGALAYFFENREYVWQCIHEDEAYAKSVRDQVSGVVVPSKGVSTDASDSAISS